MRAAAVTLTPPAKAASRNTRKDAVRNLPSNTGQATGALILLCYLFLKSNTISLKKILCGQAASGRRGMYTAAPLQICHLVLLLSITCYKFYASHVRLRYGPGKLWGSIARSGHAPAHARSGPEGVREQGDGYCCCIRATRARKPSVWAASPATAPAASAMLSAVWPTMLLTRSILALISSEAADCCSLAAAMA